MIVDGITAGLDFIANGIIWLAEKAPGCCAWER